MWFYGILFIKSKNWRSKLINIEQYNIRLFHVINSIAHKDAALDTFFIFCATYLPYIFILLLIYLWFNKKHDEYKTSVLFAVYVVALGMLINFIITMFYTHPRPFVKQLGVQLIQHVPETSFPSDHATFMFSIAIMLTFFRTTRLIGFIAVGFAFLCSIARVYCGVHFPFDIAGSFSVTLLTSTVLFLFRNRIKPLNEHIISFLSIEKKFSCNLNIVSRAQTLSDLTSQRSKWIKPALWIIGFCFMARLLTLGIIPLVDPSEGRYAMVSKDMADTGNYITPMIWNNGKHMPYWGKPPLYFWLGSMCVKILGAGEFSARLPGFISAVILLLLVYLILKYYRSSEIATLSLVIISTTGAFFILSGVVLMDMTLTLFTSGALLFYYAFLFEDRRLKKKLLSIGIFVCLALGFLTKGPVVLAVFGIPVFLWHLLNRKWSVLKSHAWVAGIVLFIAIIIPWFYLAELKTPGCLKYFFLNENFYRFFKKGYGDLYGTGHKYPFGTAIVFFLAAAAPWSAIALYYTIRKLLKSAGSLKMRLNKLFIALNDNPYQKNQKFDFFLIGFVSIILFWCLSRQLHLYYLILAVPVFGIWMASFIHANKISIAGILKLSIATLLVYLISLVFIADIVDEKKSTKSILLQAEKIKQSQKLSGDIIFVRRTPYSAYFYGQKSILTHEKESIDKSLRRNPCKENLYIIKHGYLDEISPELKKQFKAIYSSRKWTIFK